MDTQILIRALTICALAGLLGAVGLRLSLKLVLDSLRRCRLGWILVINFVAVPALTLALARLFSVRQEIAVGMIILGAAPFAPVVPIFTRFARADLALAAGLTAMFPLFSALLTPVVIELALKALPGSTAIQFNIGGALLTLAGTITLPLACGLAISHNAPALGARLLRPLEIISETAGALGLALVTVVEFPAIKETGSTALLAMTLAFEFSLWLGYLLGHSKQSSRVLALGTSNRNIALALLIALQSFPGSPVISAVVANGLLLIVAGLLHVGLWRALNSDSRLAN